MTDSTKPNWFKLITPGVLAQVGGCRYEIDPNAVDEFAGDASNKLDVVSPTGTTDVYELIESRIKK